MAEQLNGQAWSIRGLSGIFLGDYTYNLDFTWEAKRTCIAKAYRFGPMGERAVASLRLSSKKLAKVLKITSGPNRTRSALVALFDGLWVEVY